eukprot:TRINITY_DN7038_c1_g2_i1.p2 TRINITY_DN7038_c1_g2~~TRINITY_DN7038_c1_g2_i1.p2  ORF type:complete len:358 (-),score=42.70 TRINITY_DN7038_c1_g2_i1:570-1589(-)
MLVQQPLPLVTDIKPTDIAAWELFEQEQVSQSYIWQYGSTKGFSSSNDVSFHDKYELFLEKVLGKGIFGTVYICQNRQTCVRYAVKVVKNEALDLMGGIQMLVRECNVGRYLQQQQFPKIRGAVKMTECGPFQENDGAYLVMELCEGRDLLTSSMSFPVWTEYQTKKIFKQCVRILADVHSADVIHGDVKPQNFVFTSVGDFPESLRLVDFGSAQVLQRGHSTAVRQGGTKWYWGPEILEGKEVGKHTDVWALGCTLCVLLTGNLPFGRAEEGFGMTWMRNLIKGNVVGLSGAEGVSDSAKDLVRKMLVVDTETRPTCEQVLRHPWLLGVGEPSQRRRF